MSKSCTSPTARLLQNSRLFSLPKPLPTPNVSNNTSVRKIRKSDTATTPYPTHQAIDCPYSSRAIGEWGLKRHLPVRTTTKSAHPIRILAQDTNDHVTDFALAGDHTVTLEKFQELRIPILRRERKNNSLGVRKNISVYEDALDVTDRAIGAQRRWKSNGPWLVGMEADDLDQFLGRLKSQRPEWLQYLREYFTERGYAAAKKTAFTEKGIYGPLDLQILIVQRDHIIPEAEQKVRELQQGEDSDEAKAIMEEARIRADECEAALVAQARRSDAADHLHTADERSAQILQNATKNVKDALQDLPDDPILKANATAALESDYTSAKEQAQEVLREGFEEVIQRRGEEPDRTDDITLESQARRLVSEGIESIRGTEADRAARLAQWEEQERLSYRPDDEKLEELQKKLRHAHKTEQIHSELTSVITQFLDLPGMQDIVSRARTVDRAASVSRTDDFRDLLGNGFMDSENAGDSVPMTTHPAAGLGYLRTSLHVENHPIYGPQAEATPILARVLRPRTSAFGNAWHATIGLAGFVSLDPLGTQNNTLSGRVGASVNLAKDDRDLMAMALDPYKEGGNKMYMSAKSANVSEAGLVTLQMVRPDKEAIAVATGQEGDIIEHKRRTLEAPAPPSMPGTFLGLRDPGTPPSRYGAALPEARRW